MLCTAPTIRSAALSCRIQPTLSSYHTTSSSTSSPLSRPEASHTPKSTRRISLPFSPSRSASTASSPSPSSSTTTAIPAHLTWNAFFKLRKTRRWYQLGSSIGTGAGGFVLSTQALMHADMDAIASQLPLDPFISMGLITFAAGGAGWLVGPILGTGVFNWRNRLFREQMDEKEKEFYKRVKKFRVDPSVSSLANPVPDYYGEKISSVGGYRRWLKDQRAFNKKRATYA